MKQNRLLALALAGAMMTGTLAPTVPAFAAGTNTTTVSLTINKKNTYTMTVPAATTLNSDGTAKALTNGIRITEGTLEEGKKLTVEAESQNSWKMKASDVTTEIAYTLYSDAGTTAATSWEFSQAEANATEGTTKAVYAKANADDVQSAAAGSYSDVITFTASVADTVVKFTLNSIEYTVDEGTTWGQFMKGAGSRVVEADTMGSQIIIRGQDSRYVTYNGVRQTIYTTIQNGVAYTG